MGDTETTDGLAEHVRGADVLVIEATFLDRDAAIAQDYGHLTAAEAGRSLGVIVLPARFWLSVALHAH